MTKGSPVSEPEAREASGYKLTERLAAKAASLEFGQLPPEIVELARQCLLDWLGVTIAGAHEPAVKILVEEIREQGGNPQATIIRHGLTASTMQAALINGTASHALDFDDVNWSLEGHPSAAVIPGLLALAEHRNSSGRDFIAAFVAGYETACRVGRLVSPGHYKQGFHSTATAGSFGAAAACARLLGLSVAETATAMGIAGTQAAGLKSMFGTMCKPLHAGKAAQNGLFAATLAARGFESRNDVLECAQGFAATQSTDFKVNDALADPDGGYHLRANLFKYHAACYLTHATIECCRRLRENADMGPESIHRINIRADETLAGVCHIPEPHNGNEAKFSLRMMAAFALAGIDTSSIESYSENNCASTVLVSLRDKVRVQFVSGWPATKTEVDIEVRRAGNAGELTTFREHHDSGIPASDLAAQGMRLETKFNSLVAPIFGADLTVKLSSAISDLDRLASIRELILLLQT